MTNQILTLFQSFRTILCICPHCGEIKRLSDLTLKFKGSVKKTWLDTYDSKIRFIGKKEDLFEEKEDELRQKAIERGRKKVQKVVCSCLCDGFMKTKYDPYDIKAVLHPIDFIAFNGMNRGEITDISFLSKPTTTESLNILRKSVEDAVLNKKYDWKVARINEKGNISFE